MLRKILLFMHPAVPHLPSTMLQEFEEECKLQGIECRHIYPHSSSPARTICQIATDFKPHCILIGSKPTNHSVPRGFGSQSVSSYVLRHVMSPVLIIPVRMRKTHEEFSNVAAVAQAALLLGISTDDSSI